MTLLAFFGSSKAAQTRAGIFSPLFLSGKSQSKEHSIAGCLTGAKRPRDCISRYVDSFKHFVSKLENDVQLQVFHVKKGDYPAHCF